MKKGYLVLEDGQVFEGIRFGAETDSVGELVFTTSVVGYIETLTDPSYAGQIVMQTYPLVGNVGIIHADKQGACCVKGYIAREFCDAPSNFRSDDTLESFLTAEGVPALYGVDTRQLTRIIRDNGVMNAMICSEIPADLDVVKTYAISGKVAEVTCKEQEVFPAEGEEKFKVAMIDYGVKRGVIAGFCQRGCTVTLVPASTSAEEVLAMGVDGVALSNGPGDPTENEYQIQQVKALMGKLPMFGIGLGHQLMALAAGGKTVKLKYGHRGGNQPVRDLKGTRTYITSQNHGYAVEADSVQGGEVRFVNLNDNSCEGIDYPARKAFSVQFYPDVNPLPKDSAFLFDRFADLMKGGDL